MFGALTLSAHAQQLGLIPGSASYASGAVIPGAAITATEAGAFKTTRMGERFSTHYHAEFGRILDCANFRERDTSLNAATFERILASDDSRIIQFGLKLLL